LAKKTDKIETSTLQQPFQKTFSTDQNDNDITPMAKLNLKNGKLKKQMKPDEPASIFKSDAKNGPSENLSRVRTPSEDWSIKSQHPFALLAQPEEDLSTEFETLFKSNDTEEKTNETSTNLKKHLIDSKNSRRSSKRKSSKSRKSIPRKSMSDNPRNFSENEDVFEEKAKVNGVSHEKPTAEIRKNFGVRRVSFNASDSKKHSKDFEDFGENVIYYQFYIKRTITFYN